MDAANGYRPEDVVLVLESSDDSPQRRYGHKQRSADVPSLPFHPVCEPPRAAAQIEQTSLAKRQFAALAVIVRPAILDVVELHKPGVIEKSGLHGARDRHPSRPPANTSRCSAKSAFTHSITARTHAARRRSGWTMIQYSAAISGVRGISAEWRMGTHSAVARNVSGGRYGTPGTMPRRRRRPQLGVLQAKPLIGGWSEYYR